MEMIKVFVYGTLKRGHYNADLLRAGRFLGTARTAEPKILITDEYFVPWLLPIEGGYHVLGEVYGVDDATLTTLDRLEGYPEYYNRCCTEVVLDEPHETDVSVGSVVTAWIYTMPADRVTSEMASREPIEEYSLNEHLLKYVPKERRAATHSSRITTNTSMAEMKVELKSSNAS